MERTTIIVGAGALLDLDFSEGVITPSTANITKEVCKPYKDCLSFHNENVGISIVGDVFQRLNEQYPNPRYGEQRCDDDSDDASSQQSHINFEQVFHVLEMLDSYNRAWNGQCKASRLYPVFAPFTKPDFDVANCAHLHYIMEQYILRIMDIVHKYNADLEENKSANSWYADFFKALGVNADIFTFNYDTTIEGCLQDYEDGFEPTDASFFSFNPHKLLYNPQDLSTICHLHGCINYYFASYDDVNHDVYTNQMHDMYKYDSYDTVRTLMTRRMQSMPTTQSGESYFAAPIITGLRKTEKLNSLPFDFYHTKLLESIVNNPRLIIIGYGFGDFYCNQLIERMYAFHGTKCRVVLIDKPGIPKDMLRWRGGDALSLEQGTFICKMMQVGYFNDAVAQLCRNGESSGLPISNNGNLLAFFGGFKDASTHIGEIQKFLNNESASDAREH